MNYSKDKFLLSTLLAIGELENSLGSEAKDALYVIAEQLFVKPTAWETDIESNLMGIINENPSLSTIFQDFKSKLDEVDDIYDFIPTQEELEAVIPAAALKHTRPVIKPNSSDLTSEEEITNMSMQVLSSPEPSEIAKEIVKKSSKLERLLNLIRPNRSKNK